MKFFSTPYIYKIYRELSSGKKSFKMEKWNITVRKIKYELVFSQRSI
jgi:hypothetical protein